MIKKLITSRIFSFILGAILFSGVTVFAYSISSKDIAFTPSNPEWQVTNVEEAMNSLYDKSKKFDTFGSVWCCSYGTGSSAITFNNSSLPYFTITDGAGTSNYKLEFWTSDNSIIGNINLNEKYDVDTLVNKKAVLRCGSSDYKCFNVKYTNK